MWGVYGVQLSFEAEEMRTSPVANLFFLTHIPACVTTTYSKNHPVALCDLPGIQWLSSPGPALF